MNDVPSSSYFKLSTQDDVAILTFLLPRMSDDDNVEQLGFDLSAVVEKRQFRKVIVALDAVNHVSSSVLGKFITLHRQLARNEGKLVLCGVHGTLREILAAARLLTYFHSTADLPAALQAFE